MEISKESFYKFLLACFRTGNKKLAEKIIRQQRKEETKMTKEDRREIKELYNQGWNPEDIADELGLDECEVMDYCVEILGEEE